MTEEEKRAYARHLVELHATDVEYLSVLEVFEDWGEGELSDADADDVYELINSAKIEVTW